MFKAAYLLQEWTFKCKGIKLVPFDFLFFYFLINLEFKCVKYLLTAKKTTF